MSAVLTALLNVIFKKRLERITSDIKIQSEKITLIQNTNTVVKN